ncbi:hypothetical protein DH2020_026689 [Rehmannia glutinosa]|uniref:Large ribosomal subunit protein uL30 N-terminal eukaryotes domain-containing protein n=1 Tax=Rehmannia glutinosa TaxID=99300 RepID=A0ABR0VW73_REHGL
MAAEEAPPPALNYIPEVVLKKRKNNEEWAIRRKLQLQERVKRHKSDNFLIKKPEQFIREYRDKELDLIQMKSRGKRRRRAPVTSQSKLLFIIRIGGYPNVKSVKDLIYKKGVVKIGKQRVPLTDNNVVEQELGQHNIICIEDIVNEIASVGQHFKAVTNFLCPFMLNNPEKALHGKKRRFEDGGDSGNRQDAINELISKMN